MQTYEPMLGSNIEDACADLVRLAVATRDSAEMKFNDQTIRADPGSDASALARAYRAECDRRHQAYLASDAYREAKRRAEVEQRERERRLAEALAESPATITLRDPVVWQ